ncbi:LOW QUALITY PROTEIN: hypothetical protein PanWU01x14_234640 [Parasponia andersonii]|uniref:Uncharacterized protein n=1 Tax=Parasponia andersonii TaxID=3476 RepID=A0A2P5BIZ6_PARAD|nr:LOW QUALITY PROTEIN: hypothetical protein PanWU01x14_234640 [Parasponia andersonii]
MSYISLLPKFRSRTLWKTLCSINPMTITVSGEIIAPPSSSSSSSSSTPSMVPTCVAVMINSMTQDASSSEVGPPGHRQSRSQSLSCCGLLKIQAKRFRRLVTMAGLVGRDIVVRLRTMSSIVALRTVGTVECWRALNSMHVISTPLITIKGFEPRSRSRSRSSMVLRRIGIRGTTVGRGGSANNDGSYFGPPSRTDDAIDGINITLLKGRMWFHERCWLRIVLSIGWLGREQESTELRGSLSFLTVVFVKHVLQIFLTSY